MAKETAVPGGRKKRVDSGFKTNPLIQTDAVCAWLSGTLRL